MEERLVSIISSIAIVNLLLTAIVCWIKAKQYRFYLWLGLLIFASAIAMLNNLHIRAGVGHILLFHVALLLNLSFGAFLILFIRSHRGEPQILYVWKKILLFLPAFLYLPFIFATMRDARLGEMVIESSKAGKMISWSIVYNLMIVFYSIGSNSGLLVSEFKQKECEQDTLKQSVRKEVLSVMLALQLMAFVPFLLQLDINYVILYMPIFGQLYFIYLFIRMWKLEQQDEAGIPQAQTTSVCKEQKVENKYATIRLSEDKISTIKVTIIQYMENKQPYLNPEFSLSDMSQAINVPHNIISMVLNSRFHLNFADFINQYRVAQAQRLLLKMKENHLTIESIAYDCGFNNRTSFYMAFKRFTNMSPKDYIKEKTKENILYCTALQDTIEDKS